MKAHSLANISLSELKRAIKLREQVNRLEHQLARLLNGDTATGPTAPRRKKRRMSAAARARISRAAKERWAKRRNGQSARSLGAKAAATRVPARSRARRGQLKETIVKALKSAGSSGVSVKDLAAKTRRSYGNISAWFHTTAKGVKEIARVAPGRFAWTS